jgi:2-polyprenyl-3-methyl-5-hydroxy-6-metoxy-1,4-benzoquinol methylase
MKKRVDDQRFKSGHYLGLPASLDERIVHRRVELVKNIPDFCNPEYSLVDIGCGNGATIALLADQFNDCTGIDIYEENGLAFRNLMDELQIPNANFEQIDIESESHDKRYDRLICFEVIEHFKDDKHVSRLFDLLKPGGLAAITVPNKWWIFETHGAKLPLLPWNRVPFFSWLPTPLHEKWANARIYTKKRIINLLKEAGFEVDTVKYVNAPMDVLPNGLFKRMIISLFFSKNSTRYPFKSTAIFLSVRKPS